MYLSINNLLASKWIGIKSNQMMDHDNSLNCCFTCYYPIIWWVSLCSICFFKLTYRSWLNFFRMRLIECAAKSYVDFTIFYLIGLVFMLIFLRTSSRYYMIRATKNVSKYWRNVKEQFKVRRMEERWLSLTLWLITWK